MKRVAFPIIPVASHSPIGFDAILEAARIIGLSVAEVLGHNFGSIDETEISLFSLTVMRAVRRLFKSLVWTPPKEENADAMAGRKSNSIFINQNESNKTDLDVLQMSLSHCINREQRASAL